MEARSPSLPLRDRSSGRGVAARRAKETEIVARFRSRLQYVVRQRVPAECVEDVVQETLAAVLEALRDGRLRDPEKLPGFVYGTARNVISNWVRGEKRWDRARSTAVEGTETPDAQQLLMQAAEERAVAACLERLSEDDREVLRLAFFEGLTPREIAEVLGVEPHVVRQRKWRALGRFREAWSESGGGLRRSRS